MPRYKVLVDDNFHFAEEGPRLEHGTFDTAEEAITACRNIVDTVLCDNHRPGMSAAELYYRYMLFGEDPFIIVLDASAPPAPFSGWDYARERRGCAARSKQKPDLSRGVSEIALRTRQRLRRGKARSGEFDFLWQPHRGSITSGPKSGRKSKFRKVGPGKLDSKKPIGN